MRKHTTTISTNKLKKIITLTFGITAEPVTKSTPYAGTIHVKMKVLRQLPAVPGIVQTQRRVVRLHLAQVLFLVHRLKPQPDAVALQEHPVAEHLPVGLHLVPVGRLRLEPHRQTGVHLEYPAAVVPARRRYADVGLAGVTHQLGVHALLQALQGAEGLDLGRGRRSASFYIENSNRVKCCYTTLVCYSVIKQLICLFQNIFTKDVFNIFILVMWAFIEIIAKFLNLSTAIIIKTKIEK